MKAYALLSLLFAPLASLALPLNLDGPIEQGALIRGKTAPGAKVTLDGKVLKTSPQGDFVLGFGRDDKGPHLLAVALGDDSAHRKLVPKTRQYRLQKVNGVPERTVNPPEAVQARIRMEAAKVAKVRAETSNRLDFTAPLRWPLTGPITGVYGSQRIYNGTPKAPHFGVDVAAPTGTQVLAPWAGKVVLAEPDLYFSGGTLILDHGHGVSSTFLHLSALDVSPGQEVKAGDPIAKVGATGRATGPHLDWRLNWYEVRLDPALIAPPMPKGEGAPH